MSKIYALTNLVPSETSLPSLQNTALISTSLHGLSSVPVKRERVCSGLSFSSYKHTNPIDQGPIYMI